MRPLAIVDRGRGPELVGTRITVYDVYHYLEAARHPDYIAAILRLSSREVRCLINYIEQHKDEVLAGHRQIEERIARGNSPEVEKKRERSRAKLQAALAQLKKKKQQRNDNNEGTVD